MDWSRRLAVALAAATVLAGTGVALGAGQLAPLTAQRTLDSQILVAINRARADHGLAPLRPAAPLSAAAAFHSREMVEHGFFAHTSYGGGPFSQRLARFYPSNGYRSWSVGETILWVSPNVDARAAVRDWLNSPEHRRILLGSTWRELGISALHASSAPGAFQGLEATVVTADFGARAR